MGSKASVIILCYVFALLLVLWATKIFNPFSSGTADRVKYAGSGYLQHSEADAWTAQWITDSSVCPFGKLMGALFALFALIIIISYPINRAQATDKDRVDNWVFWTTLIFLVASCVLALKLNVPLFIRLIPAALVLILALVLLKSWK